MGGGWMGMGGPPAGKTRNLGKTLRQLLGRLRPELAGQLDRANPLTPVVKDGKLSVALPESAVTDPQSGVQKLIPLTLVLTDAEVGVRLIVPPFARVRPMNLRKRRQRAM